MTVGVRTAEDEALDAIVAGTSDDPFRRARPPSRRRRRQARPRHPDDAAGRVRRAARDGRPRVRHAAAARPTGCSRRRCRWTAAPEDFAYRFRVREGAVTRDVVDPYQFGQVLTRLRSAPVRRGDALPRVGEARRASPDDRRGDRRALRRLGAQRAARQRDRRLQPVGRPDACDAPARAVGRLGDLHSRSGGRRLLQVRGPHAGGHLLHKADPYARRFEVPPNTASIIWTDGRYEWRDERLDARPRRRSTPGASGRCRCTRCISGRGGACPRRATAT